VWVRHWRKAVAKDGWQALDRICDEGAPDFTIIPGGEVTETGGDSPSAICEFLYGALVSTGGLAEALVPEAANEIITELKNEVVSDLRAHGLMAGSPASGVRNPVFDHRDVKGARYWHPISLYQETTSVAWAIEPINFVTPKKGPACDRAGSLAHMFGDIRALDPNKGRRIETIALVRARPEDAQERLVERALSMLSDTCTIVPWLIDAERKRFITERERAAFNA
jgi:hypothetical protein